MGKHTTFRQWLNQSEEHWYLAVSTVGFLLVLLLTVLLFSRVIVLSSTAPPSPTPYQPKFSASQCFNLNGLREPWDTNGPDGIVVMRGYQHYLVMFRQEAERRSGGKKNGTSMPIEMFDNNHYQVDCPLTWRNHNHG